MKTSRQKGAKTCSRVVLLLTVCLSLEGRGSLGAPTPAGITPLFGPYRRICVGYHCFLDAAAMVGATAAHAQPQQVRFVSEQSTDYDEPQNVDEGQEETQTVPGGEAFIPNWIPASYEKRK